MSATSAWLPRWPGWSHLPRDSRDVLFLLAVIAWTLAPHFSHLPWWCPVLTIVVIAWRARLAIASAALPGRWPLVGVLLLAMSLTFMSHRTLVGKEAGITMLVLLMVLKTLELRARRDAMVVFFLGFFIVLTNFLYSQSLVVALTMLASVWGLLTALVLAHMPVGRPPLARAGAVAAKAALLGAPIMLVLFMLFPRMAPLWAVPGDTQAKTGLSGSLRMGGIADLAVDESIAFRVRFERGQRPLPDSLYWRGPVLGRFDGVEWNRVDAIAAPRRGAGLRVQGNGLAYEMILEPNRLPVLPLLEATPNREGDAPRLDNLRAFMRSDLQWATERPITERLTLSARAYFDYRHGPQREEPSLRDYTDLPAGFNPRTLVWADNLHKNPRYANASPEQLVAAVLATIQLGFTYTLTPGTYGDTNEGLFAIDEFWLDRKQGFCEHFATAFVVVMRALDVPARIVSGYQGADNDLQDGWHIVRNSYAHAWAEVWYEGQGWVRIDPTAAVAPERVVSSRALRPPPGVVAGALTAVVSPALMLQWRNALEQLNNQWNQWVLTYSRTQQFDLLRRLGVQSPSWEDLAYLLIGLISGASLIGAAWAWWDRHKRDPWQRLRSRIADRLAALGVEAEAHEAPRTLAARVRAQLGSRAEALAAQLEALDRLRYGRAATKRLDPAWWRGFAAAAAATAAMAPSSPR